MIRPWSSVVFVERKHAFADGVVLVDGRDGFRTGVRMVADTGERSERVRNRTVVFDVGVRHVEAHDFGERQLILGRGIAADVGGFPRL